MKTYNVDTYWSMYKRVTIAANKENKVNAYIYQADLYCEKCGEELKEEIASLDPWTQKDFWIEDSGYFPQELWKNREWKGDFPAHCENCNLLLETPL